MIALLALLTVVAQVVVLGVLVLWVLERTKVTCRRPLDTVARLIGPDALRLAWLVVAIATAGSLYFSEVRHFTPCPLCWYQRIAMYPLVLVLAVATWRRDLSVRWYVLPIALLGGVIGVYHYQLERFPEQEAIACSTAVPCTTIWFEQLGYITIPMMALSAFALVATILVLGGRSHGQGSTNQA
jgi:disulfide bond formation protein DsbB